VLLFDERTASSAVSPERRTQATVQPAGSLDAAVSHQEVDGLWQRWGLGARRWISLLVSCCSLLPLLLWLVTVRWCRPPVRPDAGPFEVRLCYLSSSAGCAVPGTTAHLTVISTERLPILVVFALAGGAAGSQVEVADLP